MAIGAVSYKDIGAIQRQEAGGGTAQTSYVDIGAVQREDVAAGTRPVKMAGLWGGFAGESGGFAG